MNKLIIFVLIGMGFFENRNLFAQSVPTPAAKQTTSVLLQNVIIHTGEGTVIEKASLLFSEGKIISMGEVTQKPAGTRIIDLNGKHIYPGLIALNSTIGLNEIEAVRATRDAAESGTFNPNARALIAYNTDSRVTPTLRANGILFAEVTPRGGFISGTSAIVQLDAWNWEDAALKPAAAMHLNWPDMKINSRSIKPNVSEQEKKINESIQEIENFFHDSNNYRLAKKTSPGANVDLRFEAMIPVFERKLPLLVHAESARQIQSVLSFKRKFNINIVLVGASDAWLVTDLLKSENVAVILDETHSLPNYEDDPIDLPYKLPAILQKAGITFAISGGDFWDQRNLAFQAGTASGYGLSKEEALTAITYSPAKILGIDEWVGSLAVGKSASFLVVEGDLLDMKSSIICQAFIEGREIDLGNRQRDLYKKFRAK